MLEKYSIPQAKVPADTTLQDFGAFVRSKTANELREEFGISQFKAASVKEYFAGCCTCIHCFRNNSPLR